MNSAEKAYNARVVDLNCIICANEGLGESPAGIHHIRTGVGMGQRSSHYDTLPLCPQHHQHGGHGVAFHAGKKTWEENFGTEIELLAQVRQELGLETSL